MLGAVSLLTPSPSQDPDPTPSVQPQCQSFGTLKFLSSVFTSQHWEVFQKVTEVFILVPALLGLKGNLEMTLASRLSTAVSVLAGRRVTEKTLDSTEPEPGRGPLCPPEAWARVEGEGLAGQVEGDPRMGGSQPWFLDVPAIPGCLPQPLLRNLPRDCLYSFDRRAPCWSLNPHRWGPPLISSPALQLGRSRARPSQPPSQSIAFPPGSLFFKEIVREELLITSTSHNPLDQL